MEAKGGGDRIYEMLEGEEGDLRPEDVRRIGGSSSASSTSFTSSSAATAATASASTTSTADKHGTTGHQKWVAPDDSKRKDRSQEEMRAEAEMLRGEMEKEAEETEEEQN